MSDSLRDRIAERADHRCEYCRLRQEHLPWITFHVEHIVARKHGGGDEESNRALACDQCNLHKGANLSGIDPNGEEIVPLFHPRNDSWSEHFHMHEGLIIGTTPTGRATVRVCDMNSPERIELRSMLPDFGA